MTDKHITGEAGLALIKNRVLDATYVMEGEYRTAARGLPAKPDGRIATTYEALGDGPKTGYHLYYHGNCMPRTDGKPPMSIRVFKEHLKWMVRHSRLHVVSDFVGRSQW